MMDEFYVIPGQKIGASRTSCEIQLAPISRCLLPIQRTDKLTEDFFAFSVQEYGRVSKTFK